MESKSLDRGKLRIMILKIAFLMRITMMRRVAMRMREPSIRLLSMEHMKKLSRKNLSLPKE
jgi:hypothetical protein